MPLPPHPSGLVLKDIYIKSNNDNTNQATLSQSASSYAKGFLANDVTATTYQDGSILQQAGNDNSERRALGGMVWGHGHTSLR